MEKQKKKVVIIGSGMGGLSCGIMLAKEGYDVTVLEKNRQFGGNLQIFVRDKCIFDTGVHYIGGLGEGQNLYKFFKYFEIMDDLKLLKCDEDGYDKVTFKGDRNNYWHAQGYENFIQQLLKQFPEEEAGLRKYCDKLKEVCRQFPIYFLEKSETNVVISESLEINTRDFIGTCTNNEKLQKVLAGTNALYAGIGDETPLYVHALVINSYIEGSYKCIKGGAQIEKLIVKNIKKYGGRVLKYQDVKRIVCDDNGVAKYLETSAGERFDADLFISNIDIGKTLDMIENSRIRKAYKNRIKSLKNSISSFVVSIVLKENTLPYQNYNHYHYESDDVWDAMDYDENTWPKAYAVFCGPNSAADEYADCISVLAYMHYEDVAQWEDTFHTIPHSVNDRDSSYQDFKTKYAERLIDVMEEKYPGLRDKIKSYHVSTPLTYRDYIGTSDGSMYGIAKDHKDPIKTFISPKTKVPNLLLTGQNLNMHGILGVTISALVTCNHIVESKRLIDKINNTDQVLNASI